MLILMGLSIFSCCCWC